MGVYALDNEDKIDQVLSMRWYDLIRVEEKIWTIF
jgi:hypothetical protein